MIKHPGIEDSRVLIYLNQNPDSLYKNTVQESELLSLWREKYYIAKQEYEASKNNSAKVARWRNAYDGNIFQIDDEGKATDKQLKALRKLSYEIVESKVIANIPAPKMSPRYHADLVPVEATEELIKHEMNRLLSEDVNDKAEHYVLIDGAVWFKVSWDPFENTHERSGSPLVTCCPIDTIFPQPGVDDYRKLEYIFEESNITLAQAVDLYGRNVISPDHNDILPIVNCYFLNKDRIVGKFTWCERTSTVLANDMEWGIRKRRECTKCRAVSPYQQECEICGSKSFKYFPVYNERLKEPLDLIVNPYRTGTSNNKEDDEASIDSNGSLPENTEIPYYLIRQLPFILYKRVNIPKSLYGKSEVELLLEDEELINKMLNKAERKSGKSKTYVTKLKDTRISPQGDEIEYVEVESPQEGQSIQVKQVLSDIQQEFTHSQLLYDIAKSTSGVTNTDQGKSDSTAISAKAKQIQLQASAQRNNSPIALRNMAYASVYEMLFKYLLAYSDEERHFVNLLPDGTAKEEVWSKYMFLAQDNNGELYYRDDFAWSVDSASEITQDRAAMWQLIDNDFINGTMGSSVDPTRALLMYWNMKQQFGYPTAKFAIAFLKDSVKKLPTQIEQALVNNPEALELALSYIQDVQSGKGLIGNNQNNQNTTGQGSGGARPNSGQKGNGESHAANVEKTNNKNRAEAGNAQTNQTAAKTGGMQGGTNTNQGESSK